ncbi:FG-GAP repeat domain-containing protein [Streptomyces sp. NPDC101490]|uniref:FG-GAP repeat domain-containing protein n=1 Tax=Streptomyces sp. NPDC101490 TaxID=3366143 RepID=UPI003829FD70
MNHPHLPGRRLVAAVAAVAAVTSGVLAAPAAAAPAAPPAAPPVAGQQRNAVALPSGARLWGNGPSGFLTRTVSDGVFRWTRHADGVTTVLPAGEYRGAEGGDVVVRIAGSVHTLYDMASGGDPVVIDTAFLGASARFAGLTGSTLVMEVPGPGGGTGLHLVGKPSGTVVDRVVTGLPGDAVIHRNGQERAGTVTLLVTGTVDGVKAKRVTLVDVASAAVVRHKRVDRALDDEMSEGGMKWRALSDISASATRVVWSERSASGAVDLVAGRWDGDGTVRVALPLTRDSVSLALLDDWAVYGRSGGATALRPDPAFALTARSLTGDGSVRLLDRTTSVRAEADGTLLVQGGTVDRGEGVYRIAPGPDGTPAATLVARTGETLALGAGGHPSFTPPTSVNLARGEEPVFGWTVDRASESRLVLTHTASGKRWTSGLGRTDRANRFAMEWTGMFDDHSSATNGAYTWTVTSRPLNGIGPDAVRTGTFRVASGNAPHDFSDSGVPDLLVRDEAGRLISYDARQTLYEARFGHARKASVIGTGWTVYDRFAAPGDLGGSPHADVVARDRSGVLWLHPGKGQGLGTRTKVGGGWQVYDELVGGSGDVNGDGRADLLAADRAGVLWLYPGTGKGSAPFGARKKVGGGWGAYNEISAVGDLAGGRAGDLVARDRAGVLWLYLGKGNGTFAARTRIGSGWDRHSDLVGVGDVNRDGRPDLVAQGQAGGAFETLSYYVGTGNWRAPFSSRREVYSPEQLGTGRTILF